MSNVNGRDQAEEQNNNGSLSSGITTRSRSQNRRQPTGTTPQPSGLIPVDEGYVPASVLDFPNADTHLNLGTVIDSQGEGMLPPSSRPLESQRNMNLDGTGSGSSRQLNVTTSSSARPTAVVPPRPTAAPQDENQREQKDDIFNEMMTGRAELVSMVDMLEYELRDRNNEVLELTKRLNEMRNRQFSRPLPSPTSSTGTSSSSASLPAIPAPVAPVPLVAQVQTTTRLPDLEKLHSFKGETDSDHLDVWLNALETHVDYYEVSGTINTDAKKLIYAKSHLTGGAKDWFKTAASSITTYDEFLVAINKRFRSEMDSTKAAYAIYDLRQKEGQTLTGYTDTFQQLLTRVPKMEEEDRVRHFTRGLNTHLRTKVNESGLKKLEEVIHLAIRLDGAMDKSKPRYEGAGGHGKTQINSMEEQEGINVSNSSSLGKEEIIERLAALENRFSGKRRGSIKSKYPKEGQPFCLRCGTKGHLTANCKIKENVCWKCKKPGHVKSNCTVGTSTEGDQSKK